MPDRRQAVRCEYLTLASGRQVHYRRAGEGPPLIILHPSPQSSGAMGAAIDAFSGLCTCIALDTPGYGLSDDISELSPSMGDYASEVLAAVDALGIEKFFLYGAATGSQIAIEIAKRQPERVLLTMLDANGHVSDEERERILKGYFPDVEPRRDGGHLLTYWDMCRNLFAVFPWNSQRAEDRLQVDLPPAAVIHAILLRYLQAGESYAKAYRVAFHCETRDHLTGMTGPATMTRWAGSPVVSIADELIQLGLPENVTLLRAGADIAERYSVQIEALRAAIGEAGGSVEPYVETVATATEGLHRTYLSTASGQLHMHRSETGSGPPLVFLHGAGGSGLRMMPLAEPVLGERPVMLIDLPGHGASPRHSDEQFASLEALAQPVIEALRETGGERFGLVGQGLGGAVAALVRREFPGSEIVICDPLALGEEERQSFLEKGLPDLTPRDSGSHLIEAWAMVRDRAAYWPWFDRRKGAQRTALPDRSPEALHQETVDVLGLGAAWREVAALEIGLDWAAILADEGPVTIAVTAAHPCPDRDLVGALEGVEATELTGSAVPRAIAQLGR